MARVHLRGETRGFRRHEHPEYLSTHAPLGCMRARTHTHAHTEAASHLLIFLSPSRAARAEQQVRSLTVFCLLGVLCAACLLSNTSSQPCHLSTNNLGLKRTPPPLPALTIPLFHTVTFFLDPPSAPVVSLSVSELPKHGTAHCSDAQNTRQGGTGNI